MWMNVNLVAMVMMNIAFVLDDFFSLQNFSIFIVTVVVLTLLCLYLTENVTLTIMV